MFSHDPLTDFTRKLLDDFIQRENELRKKTEEALSQTENVSVGVEKNTTVDIVIPMGRPSFYQSSETAVDKDTSMPNEEQQANVTEDDNIPQTENYVEQKDSLPSALDQPGPVCYSVEAILGPKIFKPCLYTAPIQELYDPKMSDNSSSDLINSSYSVANVNSATTASIAQAAVELSESKDKETSLILDDKYSVLPSIQAKTFRKPSCQDSTTSVYYNKPCEKSNLKQVFCSAEMECELLQAKGELTAISNKPNSIFKDKKVATDCNRQYISLMGSNCPSPKYLIPQDKFGCERDSKPTPSLKNNYTCLSNTSFKKQMTLVQQNLKETHSETSLKTPSSILKNVAENRKENVASPCNKTTSRLNGLFASLTPDLHRMSTANSISGNTTVQSAPRFESDCASQKVSSSIGCSSKNKREIESDTSPPAKKFHGLSASLTLDSDQSTVSDKASDKPAVLTLKRGKSVCASKKNNCGSNEAVHSSKPMRTNSKTDSHGKKLVSTSVTANLKCSNNEEGFESTKTPPARSFQSLFASLTQNSGHASTVINSVCYKPAVPSAQKVENSICDRQKVKCDSSQTLKPRQCTENTSERSKNSIHSNYMQVETSTSKQTPSNGNQGLVTSSATSELNVPNRKDDISAKTPPVKSFHSFFASLTPGSDQMSEDTETLKTLPAKSFQSLFASLMPADNKSASDNTDALSAHNVEKSKCQNSDSNQVKSTAKQNKFTQNSSESRNNQSSSSYGEVSLVNESTKTNAQKLNCPSAMSNLKSKNDPDRAKTPPSKSLQYILDVDQTSTVQPQKLEKSISDNTKVECDASEATKQSQCSESSSSKAAGRIETLNNCQNPVSSSAMSKGENPETESAKLFHNISPLDQSSVTNDSKVPCLTDLPQSMDGKLSHKRQYIASNTGNKQTEESKNEPRKKCATTNLSNVSNTAPASPQQNNNGLPNSILRTLFQQLQPYEQQEHQVCVKGSIHSG
ncbi:uncharacterized protein LOC129456172 [Periophthalmus magnuspinnatus]|uniref:uncharacterized protein LOC129456172 n=1 Tax=Periophthalmus magnuspinnatus TaxID=409849 RepID=UPI00243675C5|nr:uncharacterized protein LOC129456172 [Periophthalmus magnuspinnatus]